MTDNKKDLPAFPATTEFDRLLLAVMETSVGLAIVRHDLHTEDGPITNAQREEFSRDAAMAAFGNDTCDEHPCEEVKEIRRFASQSEKLVGIGQEAAEKIKPLIKGLSHSTHREQFGDDDGAQFYTICDEGCSACSLEAKLVAIIDDLVAERLVK